MVRVVSPLMAATAAIPAWQGFAGASAGFVPSRENASRVIEMVDRDYLDRTARIFKSTDIIYKGVPIGDAMFGGVSLRMPGVEDAKAVLDPTTRPRVSAPADYNDAAIDDPAVGGAPDSLEALDAYHALIIGVGMAIGGGIAYGIYSNWREKKIQRMRSFEQELIERRRRHDLDRAKRGIDPFALSIRELKPRIQRGEDGRAFLEGKFELWEDAVRALVEVLVEEREERILDKYPKSRRRRAISEVRYLVRGETAAVYRNPWFHRERRKVSPLIPGAFLDNADVLSRVALARLMTLEKAAYTNGQMDWPKAAIEEMRLIDPEWVDRQEREERP